MPCYTVTFEGERPGTFWSGWKSPYGFFEEYNVHKSDNLIIYSYANKEKDLEVRISYIFIVDEDTDYHSTEIGITYYRDCDPKAIMRFVKEKFDIS